MSIHKAIALCAATLLGLCSAGALADMVLDSENSGLRFISIKNNSVAEVHYFKNFSGSLSDDGQVNITVPLVDVETLVPIRNERMREFLFETAVFPVATVTAKVDVPIVKALASGDYVAMEVKFSVELHGRKMEYQTMVGVARLGDEIHVLTLVPLIVNAADFGLLEGIEQLRQLAGLQSIATAVPVTARFAFKL